VERRINALSGATWHAGEWKSLIYTGSMYRLGVNNTACLRFKRAVALQAGGIKE